MPDDSDAPDDASPAARPSRPELAPRPVPAGGRPIRPSTHADPVTAEPVADIEPLPPVVEPPHPVLPAEAPASPSIFGTRFVRQTLLPPCVVTAVGCLTASVLYFRQPADAALGTLPAAVGWAAIALGVLAAVCGVALSLSLRRR